MSLRKDRPFFPTNCAAIPAELFDRELFGHVKGAYTGAYNSSPGILESARGGTVLLDEVGELPLTVQPKLLHALDGAPVRRIGSSRSVRPDIRLICATNTELKDAMRNGSFRPDLYYRISVLEHRLPPLRDRPDDAVDFSISYLRRHGIFPDAIASEALRRIHSYAWPGNFRELENVLRRSVLNAANDRPLTIVLPSESDQAPHSPPNKTSARYEAPKDPLEERRRILAALKHAQGNKTLAAKQLGMSRSTLWIKLRLHKISSAE